MGVFLEQRPTEKRLSKKAKENRMASKKQTEEKKVTMEALLEAGAHFGHQVRRWNPKMERFIWQAKDGVHIFDLEKTVKAVEEASEFLVKAVSEGKRIVLVGTKRQAKEIIKKVGGDLGVGVVSERWLGGTITNWNQIKSRIDRLVKLKSDKLSGKLDRYTKKERLLFDREVEKLERFYGGLIHLVGAPEVLVVVDINKERVAVREARKGNVKVVGVVDSNTNPDLIDYPIPMNDDSVGAIEMVIGALGTAIEKGNKGVEKIEKKEKNKEEIISGKKSK